MCGRSRQTVEPQAVASAVGFSTNVPFRRASQYRPRENAHPGNASVIAYRTNAGGDALRAMRWGLVPSFTKQGDKPNFFRMFNARSETAAEKPSFRRLVGRRHGVVAFTGFYEWKRDEKGEKQPYYFHFKDNRPMLMATLYDKWQQGETYGNGRSKTINDDGGRAVKASGEVEKAAGLPSRLEKELEKEVEEEDEGGTLMFSYAVLTTSAAPRLRWLHERMPVLLGKEDAQRWMACEGTEASTFLKNYTSYNGEDLVWHPISKQMNQMGYDGGDCSAEIELKPAKPLPAITSFFKKSPGARASAGTDVMGGYSDSAVPTEAVGVVGGGKNVPKAASTKGAINEDEGTCTSSPVKKMERVRDGGSVVVDDGGNDGVDHPNGTESAKGASSVGLGEDVKTPLLEGASSIAEMSRGVQGAPLDLSQDDDNVEDASEAIVPSHAFLSPSSPSGLKRARTDERGVAGTASPNASSSKKKRPSATTASPAKRSGKNGTSPAVKDKRQSRLTSFFHSA